MIFIFVFVKFFFVFFKEIYLYVINRFVSIVSFLIVVGEIKEVVFLLLGMDEEKGINSSIREDDNGICVCKLCRG